MERTEFIRKQRDEYAARIAELEKMPQEPGVIAELERRRRRLAELDAEIGYEQAPEEKDRQANEPQETAPERPERDIDDVKAEYVKFVGRLHRIDQCKEGEVFIDDRNNLFIKIDGSFVPLDFPSVPLTQQDISNHLWRKTMNSGATFDPDSPETAEFESLFGEAQNTRWKRVQASHSNNRLDKEWAACNPLEDNQW